ncbi:MAG: TonB-dependent receptor, partial [Bacteroidales bacterium]
LEASYYIGADWLSEEHDKAVVVIPKMPNVDFVEMYMCALKFDLAADYFSRFYGIDFDKKPVETDALNNRLTPLLIIHFLAVIRGLSKRGLKKDYVVKENNLQSKIKGKICISQNIRLNNIKKRDDRIYCQYQEYTVDNPENRLLKKALVFSKRYIQKLNKHSSYSSIRTVINNLLSVFTDVSDEIEIYQVKKVAPNKLFKEYKEAIRIAKMILQQFDFSITKIERELKSTPVFWIDMSRLYEVYVYSKLYDTYGDKIKFQVPGYRKTAVDFLKIDENVIIDTKYKPKYDGSNGGIVDDVRQISAYAHDIKILKTLGVGDSVIPACLIIYPEKMIDNENKEEDEPLDDCKELKESFADTNILPQASEIGGYQKFYKLSIALPMTI